MQNVRIRGATGCGKSTFGRMLSARTNLPAIEIDDIHFLLNWKTRPREETIQILRERTAKPGWILVGNYRKQTDFLESNVDTVIWLDYSFPLKFWRLIKRTVRRSFVKEPCCNGNFESWTKSFASKDSILWWCITTHFSMKKQCRIYKHESATIIRFRHPKEADEWLKKLSHSNQIISSELPESRQNSHA